ncbi:hypothetical protein RRG08_020412 [Elysia crispata]|uniref:Uncharacterized protein n=1 Tax=Elysia crispata TaxID=231223 RepID=A0AAE1B6Q2_9GAST|nr:hypothetical protein RRG08_020412 [Elysia crispata]
MAGGEFGPELFTIVYIGEIFTQKSNAGECQGEIWKVPVGCGHCREKSAREQQIEGISGSIGCLGAGRYTERQMDKSQVTDEYRSGRKIDQVVMGKPHCLRQIGQLSISRRLPKSREVSTLSSADDESLAMSTKSISL